MRSIVHSEGCAPCPAPFNMAGYVLAAGTACPDKTALCVIGADQVDIWTYKGLRAAVLGIGTGFLRAGLKPNDKVLIRLGNSVDFPLAYLGALAVGLVPVPTSPDLTEPETALILKDLSPAAVIKEDGIACAPHHMVISVDTLRAFRDLAPADVQTGDPNRLGYVIYTSGTSGRPRAVAHAHRAIWARQMMFEGWYGLRQDDRVLHAGAFNWTYTMGTGLMDPWTKGATALIPAPGTPVDALPDIMRAHNATIFAAAPGVYRQITQRATNLKIPSLRHGLSAGEKLPSRIASAWFQKSGTHVYEAYGMSECSTFISQPAGQPVCKGTSGRPQPGRHVALLRDGEPVPMGEEGTIAVHHDDPGLMLGYLNDPEHTRARMAGPWFLTGDQAVMQPRGDITYLGRNDDMMNAGGYRVSPLEVETVLAQMPGVDAVGVADVEVKADVRVIAAFYTSAAPLDDAAWQAYVSDKLTRYKQPRIYIHLAALPVGANGKLQRRVLARKFETSHA